MASKKITLKQAAVVITIRNFQHIHGYMPTVEELARETNRARGTVFQHLRSLMKKGVIRMQPKKARSIEILQPAA